MRPEVLQCARGCGKSIPRQKHTGDLSFRKVILSHHRYGLGNSPVRDLLYICNHLYLSRPSPRLAALAKPHLDAMGDRARVGIHVRYGDATLPVYGPSDDRRYHAG